MVPGPSLQVTLSRSGPCLPPLSLHFSLKERAGAKKKWLGILDSLLPLLLKFFSIILSSKSHDQSHEFSGIHSSPLIPASFPGSTLHAQSNPEFSRFKIPLTPAVALAPRPPCTLCLVAVYLLPSIDSAHFLEKGNESEGQGGTQLQCSFSHLEPECLCSLTIWWGY